MPFITADDSSRIEEFRPQNKIFFGRIDKNFYRTHIKSTDLSAFALNNIVMFASFQNRRDLLEQLLKRQYQWFEISIILFPTTNPRSVYLHDRYVAQTFQHNYKQCLEVFALFSLLIPSLLRNYVLDRILITSSDSYQISLTAMEGRVEDGFPVEFVFKFRIPSIEYHRTSFMVSIASHVQKSNPPSLKYIICYLIYYFPALPDASFRFILNDCRAFAEENSDVLEFMIKHNIMIEVSQSTLKQLKEYPESDLIYLIPLLTVNPQNLASMLLSAKSPAELRILEAISSPIESEKRIDNLYFILFNDFDTEARYYEVRHIFKY